MTELNSCHCGCVLVKRNGTKTTRGVPYFDFAIVTPSDDVLTVLAISQTIHIITMPLLF